MDQHVEIIRYASEDYWDAVELVDLLDDVKFRVKQYAKCIAKATPITAAGLKRSTAETSKQHFTGTRSTMKIEATFMKSRD